MEDPPGYGGIRGWAGYIAEVVSIHLPSNSILYKIFPFDCDGRGIPRDGDYRLTRTELPPKPGIYDSRSLKSMMSGCCPPQVAAGMFGDVEGVD